MFYVYLEKYFLIDFWVLRQRCIQFHGIAFLELWFIVFCFSKTTAVKYGALDFDKLFGRLHLLQRPGERCVSLWRHYHVHELRNSIQWTLGNIQPGGLIAEEGWRWSRRVGIPGTAAWRGRPSYRAWAAAAPHPAPPLLTRAECWVVGAAPAKPPAAACPSVCNHPYTLTPLTHLQHYSRPYWSTTN